MSRGMRHRPSKLVLVQVRRWQLLAGVDAERYPAVKCDGAHAVRNYDSDLGVDFPLTTAPGPRNLTFGFQAPKRRGSQGKGAG
eukprot:10351735-Alexandrium_andersonii.AAC.1